VFSKLLLQVRETIEKYQMLASGDRVLVGVSGGADSVCLALVLVELGYDVAIAHLNHGLRGIASDNDENFTAELARHFRLQFFVRKAVLASGNVEAAGRTARKHFFREIAAQGYSRIALAHTRNDRVETFLLNLFRGAGSEGLTSMAPISGMWIRPLIDIDRTDIEVYLADRNQGWCTDASNFDLQLSRNRIRHVVLPQLVGDFNPNLIDTLSRTVEILESEDSFIGSVAKQWLNDNGTNQPGQFVINVEALRSMPVGIVRRIVRDALRRAGSELRDVSFDQIENIRRLMDRGKSGKIVEIPGGLEVAREFDELVFRARTAGPSEYDYELKIPGSIHIPELGKVFRAEVVESETQKTHDQRVFVDADSIGPYVRIRNWKPGDYYRPVGLPAGKLKKLFQRSRIPRSHRASWPVVVADSSIIWVASFPVSREFAPRGRSQKIVAIEALQI